MMSKTKSEILEKANELLHVNTNLDRIANVSKDASQSGNIQQVRNQITSIINGLQNIAFGQ